VAAECQPFPPDFSKYFPKNCSDFTIDFLAHILYNGSIHHKRKGDADL
jgi:hypothetical protein